MNEPYASAGVATAAIAAKSAQFRETTIRARKYVGKIAVVIAIAPAYLIAE